MDTLLDANWKQCPFTYAALTLLLLYCIQLIWGVIYLVKLVQVPRRKAQKSFLFFTVLESVTRMGFFGVWPTQISINNECTPNAMDSYSFIMDFLGTIPVCFFLTAFSLYIFTFARVHKLFQLQYLRWPPRRVLLFYRFLSITFIIVNVTVYVSTLIQLPFNATRDDKSPDNLATSFVAWLGSLSPTLAVSLPDKDTIHDTSAILAIYSIVVGTLLLAIVFIIIATSLANTLDEYLYLEQLRQHDDLAFAGGDAAPSPLNIPSIAVTPAVTGSTATARANAGTIQLADADIPLLTDADEDTLGRSESTPSLQHIPSVSASGRFGIHGLGGNFRRGAAPATERTRSKRDVLSFFADWLSPRRDRGEQEQDADRDANTLFPRNTRPPVRAISIYKYHADNVAVDRDASSLAFLDPDRRPKTRGGSYTYTSHLSSSSYTSNTYTQPRPTPSTALPYNPLSTPSSFSVRLERGASGGLVPRHGSTPNANIRLPTQPTRTGITRGDLAASNNSTISSRDAPALASSSTTSTASTTSTDGTATMSTAIGMPPEADVQQLYSYGVRGRPALNPHKNPMRKLVHVAWVTGFCLAVRAAMLPIFNVLLDGSIHWGWLLAYFVFAELMPVLTMLSVFEIAAAPTVQWNNAYGIDISLASDRALNYALHMYNLYQHKVAEERLRKEREARGEYDVVEEGIYHPAGSTGRASGVIGFENDYYAADGHVLESGSSSVAMDGRMGGSEGAGDHVRTRGAVYGSSVPVDDAMMLLSGSMGATNEDSGDNLYSFTSSAPTDSVTGVARSFSMNTMPMTSISQSSPNSKSSSRAYTHSRTHSRSGMPMGPGSLSSNGLGRSVGADAGNSLETLGKSYVEAMLFRAGTSQSTGTGMGAGVGSLLSGTGNSSGVGSGSGGVGMLGSDTRDDAFRDVSRNSDVAQMQGPVGTGTGTGTGLGLGTAVNMGGNDDRDRGKSGIASELALHSLDTLPLHQKKSFPMDHIASSDISPYVSSETDLSLPLATPTATSDSSMVMMGGPAAVTSDSSVTAVTAVNGVASGSVAGSGHGITTIVTDNDTTVIINDRGDKTTVIDNNTAVTGTSGLIGGNAAVTEPYSALTRSLQARTRKEDLLSVGIQDLSRNADAFYADTKNTPTPDGVILAGGDSNSRAVGKEGNRRSESGMGTDAGTGVFANIAELDAEVDVIAGMGTGIEDSNGRVRRDSAVTGNGLVSFGSCLSEAALPPGALIDAAHSLNASTSPLFTSMPVTTPSARAIPASPPSSPSKLATSVSSGGSIPPSASASSAASGRSQWIPTSLVEDSPVTSLATVQPIAIPFARENSVSKLQTPARPRSGFVGSVAPASVAKTPGASLRNSSDYMSLEFGKFGKTAKNISFGSSESFRAPSGEDEYERFTREMQSTLTSDSLDKSLLGEDRAEYDY